MMRLHYFYFLFILLIIFSDTQAQNSTWQQRVNYEMNIDFDVEKHQFAGTQKLTYFNNSPDTLKRLFYHLYFNAFQPGSMMDIRSRTIADPDPRVGKRIHELKENEIGYHKITSLKQDGKAVSYEVAGTILEVELNTPLLPNQKAVMEMDFNSQVPIQIRRSGRNNKEKVAYSMSQWYPKVSEYDIEGWHANPYIGREFHGVWGDFDVTITIDSSYTIGGTGYLQNPQEIGKGYEDSEKKLTLATSKRLSWKFKAPSVHDFAWAADTGYVHEISKVPNGPTLHFFHKNDSTINARWKKMQPYAVKCFEQMNKMFGAYPYKQYSVIQGGDGGMEYPMATLISGSGKLSSLISVTVHESIHSWFQGLLATNESKYSWMDEGFTSYAQHIVMDSLYKRKKLNPHKNSYNSYFSLVRSGLQEPLSTHADHYNTNRAYGTAAYSIGAIFLHQLSYVIGQKNVENGLKTYFNQWKFKHPTPHDLKRIMEKQSDIELDWYFEYWIHSTKTIDYAIKSVNTNKKSTDITLSKIGDMPMPIDLSIELKNGEVVSYYIPLRIMRGEKKENQQKTQLLKDWPWTYPEYTFTIPYLKEDIENIEIDSTQRMADVNRKNNIYPQHFTFEGGVK